jgi:hypothetical protein
MNKEKIARGLCVAGLFATSVGCAAPDKTKYIDFATGTLTPGKDSTPVSTATPTTRFIALRGEGFTVKKISDNTPDIFEIASTKNWWEASRSSSDDLNAGISAIRDKCTIKSIAYQGDNKATIIVENSQNCLPELK